MRAILLSLNAHITQGILIFYLKKNNRKYLFLTVLEAKKFKIEAPAFLVQSWWLTAMLSHHKRGEGTLWGVFHKDTNPLHEGSTLMT